MDLCCGTGQLGRVLKNNGWDIKGLDVCDDMVKISSNHFPTFEGEADNIPFKSNYFHLIVCRQSFQFLNAKRVLSEISRVLAPNGIFILSLTVPFSDADRDWLYRIHKLKQPLLLKFYTAQDLVEKLIEVGFVVKEFQTLKVRESINKWMNYAPELNKKVRSKVISMVKNAPDVYRKLHNVKVVNGEVFEDWNWLVLKSSLQQI